MVLSSALITFRKPPQIIRQPAVNLHPRTTITTHSPDGSGFAVQFEVIANNPHTLSGAGKTLHQLRSFHYGDGVKGNPSPPTLRRSDSALHTSDLRLRCDTPSTRFAAPVPRLTSYWYRRYSVGWRDCRVCQSSPTFSIMNTSSPTVAPSETPSPHVNAVQSVAIGFSSW